MDIAQTLIYPLLFLSLFFEVFLLLTFIEGRKAESTHTKSTDEPYEPSVAIIVPCYNESAGVLRTIESILGLHYPAEKLSVIAVNDGSTDDTWEQLQQFAAHPQVQVLTKENGGKHSAMNLALTHTSAEIIGCLDADSHVEPQALIRSVQHFKNSAVAATTPYIKVCTPRTWIQRIQHAEYSLSAFVRKAFGMLNAIVVTPGPFSLFRKSAIDTVGPWQHGHTTEDYEMALRLHAHGFVIANEPGAVVYTKTPHTLYRLYKQRIRWVYGFIKNTYDYRSLLFNSSRGSIGMLVLPAAAVFIVGALYTFALLLSSAVQALATQIVRIDTVGLSLGMPTFDVFFVSTAAFLFIAAVLLLLTACLIVIGRSIGNESPLSFNIVLYLALFGFIAPLWITSAAIKVVSRSQAQWWK